MSRRIRTTGHARRIRAGITAARNHTRIDGSDMLTWAAYTGTVARRTPMTWAEQWDQAVRIT